MTLIQIKKPEFNVELEIAYATSNNFTGDPIYKLPVCFLHEDAILKLDKAIYLASKIGLRFKIFDGFRPQEAQEKMWRHTPDPTFLADPKLGSNHSRGIAIDLTLVDSDGVELDMGCEFDHFTPISYHANTEISKEAQQNRFTLLGIMTAAGWDFYDKEWWHYQLFNPKSYPLLSQKETGLEIV